MVRQGGGSMQVDNPGAGGRRSKDITGATNGWTTSGRSIFLGRKFQVQDNIHARIKARYAAGLRFRTVLFRVQLIVGIRIETAETKVSLVVRNVAFYLVGPHVL